MRRLTPRERGENILGGGVVMGKGLTPRERGENLGKTFVGAEKMGSPPRTRGKRSFLLPSYSHPRLTPANAGKTVVSVLLYTRTWAHPRERGENRR